MSSQVPDSAQWSGTDSHTGQVPNSESGRVRTRASDLGTDSGTVIRYPPTVQWLGT